MPGILIIVENLPVPQDRRVWQEALALARAGFTVSVICPKMGRYTEAYELRDGIHVYRHSLPTEASGIAGYVLEYVWAWVAELRLAIKVKREVGFDAIQACNPPDTIFAIGLLFRWFKKTKFVFDHHDPFADLFAVKFPGKKWIEWLPRLAERASLRCADQVITTSEELRKLAVDRHGVDPAKVQLVRSGLDLKRLPTVEADPALKRGRPFLALYVGVMGVQDGLDLLLQAVAHIVHGRNRHDITFALAGSGTEVPMLKEMARSLKIEEWVEFTGHLEGAQFLQYFATADAGLCPDPKNQFNDKLSMNKVLEYMAFGLPVIQFDLDEGRFIAADASMYAMNNDPQLFGDTLINLLDDPSRRAQMGTVGRQRLTELFAWEKQEEAYVAAYRRLLGDMHQKT